MLLPARLLLLSILVFIFLIIFLSLLPFHLLFYPFTPGVSIGNPGLEGTQIPDYAPFI